MSIPSNPLPSHSLQNSGLCWIHLQDLHFFIYLGVNPHEKKIGQNIKMDLSLQIPYENTHDKIENTLDYGQVYELIQKEIENIKEVNLLEYLCEFLLSKMEENFSQIKAAKIIIQKGYVPLPHYPGVVVIEAQRVFIGKI